MVYRFPVEAGHIMMFARAIADPNPAYCDPGASENAAGVIAPPTFVLASAHFDPAERRRPQFGEPWIGSGREATGRPPENGRYHPDFMLDALHAETHYEYFRPVRAGDVLTATVSPGKEWVKEGRSGTLHFHERVTEYRDEADDLVVRTRWVDVQMRPHSESAGA